MKNITPVSPAFDEIFAWFKNARQNCILLLDTSGVILNVNPAFILNFGYEPEAIQGKNFSLLFTEEDRKNGLPQKELENVLTRGQSNDNNYLLNKKSETIWVSGESLLIQPSPDVLYILKVIQNIHIQKSSEISLSVLNSFNEKVLATIQDSVIILDEKMNIIKSNEAFSKLVEKRPAVFLNFSDFLKQYDPGGELSQKLQNTIQMKSSFSLREVSFEVFPGNRRVFEVSCSPLLNSNNTLFLLVIHDVSVVKQMEREREDTIGFVTHELRNPLTNIFLLHELMSEAIHEKDINKIEEIFSNLKRSSHRINKIVEGLIESTKIVSGSFELEFTKFDFGNMVDEVIDILKIQNHSVNISVEKDGDFDVVADRQRLTQVLMNYFTNAIKYSEKEKSIQISITHSESFVTVGVSDKGMGITKDSLPYVFERFFRIRKSSKIDGLGLGLYLCKQIIHAHHGQVWAESDGETGSTFYFSIPLEPNPAA